MVKGKSSEKIRYYCPRCRETVIPKGGEIRCPSCRGKVLMKLRPKTIHRVDAR